MKDFLKKAFGGIFIGFINGMFGAGGGMVAVPLLNALDFKGKDAHTASVAVILPLSVITLIMYIFSERVALSDGVGYILPGIIGAATGTFIISKISSIQLKRVFGVLMVIAGIRLVFK